MRSVRSVWENSKFLTLLSRILSQTFRSSPYSRRPSGKDRRDRTCDTPLPCCQDSPLFASPGLWCSDASSAKNEEGSRTGYDVYHHYSVPTILQVVTRICFQKKLFYYRFAEDKLHSAI